MESKTQTIENIDELIIAYKFCTDEKKKRMLHISIVEIGMQFVKKIAGNISIQSKISNEDLVQVGSIGLIKAIEFFNPNKNTKFKTYASYFIRGEIKHYLRDKASITKARYWYAGIDAFSFIFDSEEIHPHIRPFQVPSTSNGAIYYPNMSRATLLSKQTQCGCATNFSACYGYNVSGDYCSMVLLMDNWEFKKDYPWKRY